MPVQASDIADLLTTTLENVEKLRFVDITSPLQRYIAMSRLMKKHKTVFDSGTDFQWDLMTNDSGSAEFVSLDDEDVLVTQDVMARGVVPWRHITWNWTIDRREIAMNRAPLKIVDMALTRRIAAFISAVKKFEKRFWRCPAVTDLVNPYGVPYWIVKSATEGFYGLLPSGYTTVAGINPSAPQFLNDDGTSRFANYTGQYSAVTEEDLIRKWRRMAMKIDFDTPMEGMPVFKSGDDMGWYTTLELHLSLVEMLKHQNDNLGNELAKYENDVMFMQKPVTWVPQLDEDTTNPIYGIPWGEFGCAGLRGEWLHETVKPVGSRQHNKATNFTDSTLNFFLRNRRSAGVLATGTSMPA